MDITPEIIRIIERGLNSSGVRRTALSVQMGYNKNYLTRLLGGKIKRLSNQDAITIEDALGIDLVTITRLGNDEISKIALQMDHIMSNDPEAAKLVESLIGVFERNLTAQEPGIKKDIIAALEKHGDDHEKASDEIFELFKKRK